MPKRTRDELDHENPDEVDQDNCDESQDSRTRRRISTPTKERPPQKDLSGRCIVYLDIN